MPVVANLALGSYCVRNRSIVLSARENRPCDPGTISIPSLNAGSHTFVASYAGDPLDIPSTSVPFTELVQLRPPLQTPRKVKKNEYLSITPRKIRPR
jgi:hypothetical protein